MSGAKVDTKPGMNRSFARYNSPSNSSRIGQISSSGEDIAKLLECMINGAALDARVPQQGLYFSMFSQAARSPKPPNKAMVA